MIQLHKNDRYLKDEITQYENKDFKNMLRKYALF